jgi:hypothetical protein
MTAVELDRPAIVYAVECLQGESSWDETFNTSQEVTAFLRGLRCHQTMGGQLEVAEGSAVEILP